MGTQTGTIGTQTPQSPNITEPYTIKFGDLTLKLTKFKTDMCEYEIIDPADLQNEKYNLPNTIFKETEEFTQEFKEQYNIKIETLNDNENATQIDIDQNRTAVALEEDIRIKPEVQNLGFDDIVRNVPSQLIKNINKKINNNFVAEADIGTLTQ